jgi:hypothetical protein
MVESINLLCIVSGVGIYASTHQHPRLGLVPSESQRKEKRGTE